MRSNMDKEKILIVEDDVRIQKLYDKGLSEDVYEKRFSGNGVDALEMYKSWAPDIVILDIGLPEMDGYSVLKKIRIEIKDGETIVIMATGVNDRHKINDCINLGISAYITKPFNFKEINNIVTKTSKGVIISS
jgi:DNA-binding response OmpR family regulator